MKRTALKLPGARKILEKMMKENLQNAACDRAEDLVAYLYGEASRAQAIEFKRHMEQCVACSAELSAFKSVREDVIEWRNQSLPSFESSGAQGFLAAKTAGNRSALAAIREFFALAPTWMRAATAMAAVVICALIVFTVAHFSEQPKMVVKVVPTAPTESQVNELVNKRVEELRSKEQQEAKAAPEAVMPVAPEQRPVLTARDNSSSAQRARARRPTVNSTQVARQSREATDKSKASQEARQQLAELVQQTSKEDDSLPRLSDLLEDSNESQ